MLDINLIREEPDLVKRAMLDLNAEAPIDEILALDARRREYLNEVEMLRAERNAASKEIGRSKDQEVRQAKIQQMRAVGDRIKVLETELNTVDAGLSDAMLQVPNLPAPGVPVGTDEEQNVIVRQEGQPRAFDFEPVPHWDLGPTLDIIDFERGVKLSGTRFYVLKGLGARLQRALVSWMLDLHLEQGYTEIYPPFMVRQEMMVGAAQLPKFEENIYHDAEEDYWFIGTGEIPLTNLHRDEILPPDVLPLSYTAYSCLLPPGKDVGRPGRAGHKARPPVRQGRDVQTRPSPKPPTMSWRGWSATPRRSARRWRSHTAWWRCAPATWASRPPRKYDLELWAPGVEEWLEVSSISNCTDFQARRANIRYRPEKGAKARYVHTLNGSGLALPRTMIAIMENYQQADGSITVPAVLRPYMGGIERID